PIFRRFVIVKVSAHSKMKNQCTTLVESDDQVFPSSRGLDKTTSAHSFKKSSNAGTFDHIRSGYDDPFNALAQRRSLEVQQPRFYFRKFGHGISLLNSAFGSLAKDRELLCKLCGFGVSAVNGFRDRIPQRCRTRRDNAETLKRYIFLNLICEVLL